MKTFKSIGKISTILLLSASMMLSCNKKDVIQDSASSSSNSFTPAEFKNGIDLTSLATISFCSTKTVPLCADGSTVGSVEVKRGSDGKFYVTYTTNSGWYLGQINLYAGLYKYLPNQLDDFANRKTFSYPFNDQTYSFTLTGLPSAFAVVANAILVKKSSSGYISSVKVAWGDGCNGKEITCKSESSLCTSCSNEELVGGAYFNYTSTLCTIAVPVPPVPVPTQVILIEPDICSQLQYNYFGIHPDYGCIIPWSEPTVTVAGQVYTEAEARAIADAPDVLGLPQDSKYAFQRVATLRLSHTDYNLSPTLGPNVKTIEDWLATKGKLTPTNLPTGNVLVKTAAIFLDTWIAIHPCTGR